VQLLPDNLWQSYRTTITKTVHNVEKFILFNILKLKLWYCNPFWIPDWLK